MPFNTTTRPNLRARVLSKLPATLTGTGGLTIEKVNGVWTIQPSFDDLALITTVDDAENQAVWVYNSQTDVYNRMSVQAFLDYVGSITSFGVHEIGHWPARAMKPANTSGCDPLAVLESSSNQVNDEYLGFVNGSTTYAGFSFRAPEKLDEGSGFTAQIEWTEAAGASAHVCRWQVEMQAQGDGDTIDSAWGTAVAVDDTGSSGTRRFITTGTITPGGSWAAGDKIHVRVARLGGHGNDTLDADARLIGVTLFATVNAATDA